MLSWIFRVEYAGAETILKEKTKRYTEINKNFNPPPADSHCPVSGRREQGLC